MDPLAGFFQSIKDDMTMLLATAEGQSVTMRAVSPVYYQGAVLMFTHADSVKYRQLKANPHCCIAAGGVFAECGAEFCGGSMLPQNEGLRAAYCAKFPGAFDEGVAFGGRDAELILLKPTRITGWTVQEGASAGEGIPNVPFEILC